MQSTSVFLSYFVLFPNVGLTDFDSAVQLSVLHQQQQQQQQQEHQQQQQEHQQQQQQQQYDQVGLYYMDNISKYVRQLDRAIAKLEKFNQFAIENINILLIVGLNLKLAELYIYTIL